MISDEQIQSWANDLTEEEPLKHVLLELLALRRHHNKTVILPDDGLDDCIRDWPDQWRDNFDTGYNYASWRYEQEMEKAGVKFKHGDF